MPITSAARRASLASSSVQHPRAPERYDFGLRERARWMPVTSWPASAARAAATAESTPPDIAARTRISAPFSTRRPRREARGPRPLDDRPDRLDQRRHVRLGRGVAEREAQRGARLLVAAAHGEQDVRRLRYAGVARRPGRAFDPARVEQHQERVALAAGEGEVRVAGKPM